MARSHGEFEGGLTANLCTSGAANVRTLKVPPAIQNERCDVGCYAVFMKEDRVLPPGGLNISPHMFVCIQEFPVIC